MFALKQSTHIGGDCTAGYNVILDKNYTVSEFIDEVLQRKEWGTIYADLKSIEYKRDKLLGNFSDNILSKEILSVKSSGGWSLMDYYIEVNN